MSKLSFKKQVEQAQKSILNTNEDWYENFLSTQFSECETKKNKSRTVKRKHKVLSISLCSTFAAAIILIVGLVVWVSSTSMPNQNTKFYLAENERNKQIELTEFNNSLGSNGVHLNIDDIYGVKISLVYDLDSGDALYYKVQIANEDVTYETVLFEVYVNKHFKNKKTLQDEPIEGRIHNTPLKYNLKVTDDGWAWIINYIAVIEYKDISIYINYEQLSLEENSNFFTFLEHTIEFN